MDDLFYDRISGVKASSPEVKDTLLGRWLIKLAPGTEAFLNSVAVRSDQFLTPELSGAWHFLDGTGTALTGGVARDQLPDEIEAESVRTIGAHLSSLVAKGADWPAWSGVTPLVPGMSETAELLPLEHKIREHLGHLEAVCAKPKAHLHVEVERVPIARARRIPPRAASYLAAHTEDWERPLVRGVLPKQILSEVRHDQIDIYENRVAACLVDHLLAYLNTRVRKLRKLLKVFQDKENYSEEVGGTYLRRNRILELWGQSIDANEGREKVERTLGVLEWLKYKVMGLKDSVLYKEVPRRAFVSPTLRATNILANDQHYRRVAELWREWASGHAKTKTPADIHKEAQELCHGLDRFGLLLVMRALEQLGYSPTAHDLHQPVSSSTQWTLRGHGTSLDLAWQADGTIRVERNGATVVFLPLAVDLRAARNDEQAGVVLDHISTAGETRGTRTTVLYLGAPDGHHTGISDPMGFRLHTVGNDPRTSLPNSLGILPISPWDIGSVDRIARSLRWFLDSARFDEYPLVIDVGSDALSPDVRVPDGWLEKASDGSSLTMRRAPQDFEWEQLASQGLLDKAKEIHQGACAQWELASDQLRKAVSRGSTGTLNQQKKASHQECVRAEKQLAATEVLCEALEDARTKTSSLLVCPACATAVDPAHSFHPRSKGCFRCECTGCRTTWATRLCGNGHKYAVMRPGNLVTPENTSAGWEDRTYGSDLLAVPARTLNGEWGFVCPTCGDIN